MNQRADRHQERGYAITGRSIDPSTPDADAQCRVFFRDVKPYAIVDDLDQLHGPAGGVVELSHSVLWAPGGPYVDAGAGPLVYESDAGGSIDAHPFTDADGNRYLYWKNDGNAVGVDTWISAARHLRRTQRCLCYSSR